MKESKARLGALQDDALPAMPFMLGRSAADLLSVATAPAGGRVISARPRQVDWQPGRALTVVYSARVAWGAHRVTQERFVMRTGANIPDDALMLGRDADRMGVWTPLTDARLPGLALALDARRVCRLLEGVGVSAEEAHVKLRAYRPGRRGVVEVRVGAARLFVKAVPPTQVAALQARHALLSECLPVPRSHGWSEEHGLVVLEAMPGYTLRDVLSAEGLELPEPLVIANILDSIPALGDGLRSPGVLAPAAGYAHLLGRLLPDLRPRLAQLVSALTDEGAPGQMVPVHGDLHEAQLMVRDGAFTGVLDVDTAALGYRMDDWANMVGHLATRLDAVPQSVRPRVQEYAKRVLAVAESQVDPAELRRRAAAVILALATGPFRVQTPAWPAETRQRVALAELWWESAVKIASRKPTPALEI